jgi:H+/Cl- antiporter ClcA
MTMDSVKVEGQTIGQTYELDADIVGEPTIASLQCDFFLCEADYVRLTTRASKFLDASVAVLLISVGFGISVAAKLASAWWSHTAAKVESWEYWALAICILVAGILAVVSRLVPNEKRSLLKQMKEHFESHPRQRKVMRRIDGR